MVDASETAKILQDFESALLAINTDQLGGGVYLNPTKNSGHLDKGKDIYFNFFSSLVQNVFAGDFTGNYKEIDLF